MQITDDIRRFITDNFMYGQDDGFENSASLLAIGLIDSTGVLELVAFIEEKYKISVMDEEIIPENFDSVNNLKNYVMKKTDNCQVEAL